MSLFYAHFHQLYKTIDRYKSMMKRIDKHIGHMKLAQIKPQHLNNLYAALAVEGIREDNYKVVATDAFLEYLINNKIRYTDIRKATRMSPSTIEKIKAKEPIARSSAEKLCLKFKISMGTYFTSKQGKWKNVNLEKRLAKIDCELISIPSKGVYESPTKTRKTRYIWFSDETASLLEMTWKLQEHNRQYYGEFWIETGYVFTQDHGDRMHPDSVTGWLSDFSKKTGLPHIHPHAFRHTAASLMIANGVDLVTTATELGHANANTTAAIYAHQIAEQRALAADIRSSIFRSLIEDET